MLNMPVWKFYGTLFAFYLTINFLFGSVYFIIGKDQFQGVQAVTYRGNLQRNVFFQH